MNKFAVEQGGILSASERNPRRSKLMQVLVGLIEHIGDIVACEPVSRYIKSQYPNCTLSWAVAAPWRVLIDSNPHIDDTIIVECVTDWMKIVNHGEFDLVVDLHVNYRVCQCCRIPLVKKHGNPFVNVYEWFDYGAILQAFSIGAGLPKLSNAPSVYIGEAERRAVDGLALPERFCVIHRSSNNPDKDWPREQWLTLCSELRALGLFVVEVGAGRDAEGLDLAEGYRSLINETSLLETAEVIRRAKMFVGIDSSPAHFANAVNTPGVVMLGHLGYFKKYNPFTGFYGGRSSLVKLVHNLTGPTCDLPDEPVIEAVRYVSRSIDLKALHEPDGVRSPLDIDAAVDENLKSLVEASGFFDPEWYRLFNPDVASSGLDPLTHYLLIGAPESRSPGPDFDAAWYLAVNTDVAAAKINPLVHYVTFGADEERLRTPTQALASRDRAAKPAKSPIVYKPSVSSLLTPFGAPRAADVGGRVDEGEFPLVLAFYLPQFHPIMENDWAHGMGFTEWTNVVKAEPLFESHYQPRQPGELGFYDLRSADVLREQLKLALSHGISGFCFYYYYFEGRKLLYKPIDNYLKSDAEAPFCFLWANENWTKRWDGGNREVIIEQQHSDHDDCMFIVELAETFRDQRYIKIDGKPLLLVYKPHLFPDVLRTTELWRKESQRLGFAGLYLVMVDDWFEDLHHPREWGFDATYEIPSNIVHEEVRVDDLSGYDLADDFSGEIVDYHKFASFHSSRPEPPYKRFKTVMLPWDNTPRYASKAKVHVNTDTGAFRTWLTQACVNAYDKFPRNERIVFLHSWNEWCEGTYIEPDGRWGRKFLEEARSGVEDARQLIGVMAGNGVTPRALMTLQHLMREKEEGSLRILQIARSLTHYLRDIIDRERERAGKLADDVKLLEEAATSDASAMETERLTFELAASRRHSENLQAELEGARHAANELAASRRHSENLQAELESARHAANELAASRQHSANLQAQLDAVRQSAARLQSEIADNQRQAYTLQGELDQYRQHATNLETEIATARESLAAVQSDAGSKEERLSDLDQVLKAAQAELDAIHRSKAWRLTGPLRRLRHSARAPS